MTLIVHEAGQDGELLRREAERLAVQRGRVGALVERDAAAFERAPIGRVARVGRCGAAQPGATSSRGLKGFTT